MLMNITDKILFLTWRERGKPVYQLNVTQMTHGNNNEFHDIKLRHKEQNKLWDLTYSYKYSYSIDTYIHKHFKIDTNIL